MKYSEAYRILLSDGWYPVSQKGSHMKLRHKLKPGIIFFRIMEVKRWEKDWKKHYLSKPE